MPTREGFDVVPLRKTTKARLRAIKGDGSFDDAIQALLDRASSRPLTAAERPRDAEEQLALADLAARRWALEVARGRIVERGPRLVELRTGRRSARSLDVRLA